MPSMTRDFAAFVPLKPADQHSVATAYAFVADFADLEADSTAPGGGLPTYDEAFAGYDYDSAHYVEIERTGCLDLALSLYTRVVEQLEKNFDAEAGESTENWPRDLKSVELAPVPSGLWIKKPRSSAWASSDVAIAIIQACQEHFNIGEVKFTVRHGLRGQALETSNVEVAKNGEVSIAPFPVAENSAPETVNEPKDTATVKQLNEQAVGLGYADAATALKALDGFAQMAFEWGFETLTEAIHHLEDHGLRGDDPSP